MLNCLGQRFVDEGQDFRNYTYAAFGKAVLAQPDGIAFQIFDSAVTNILREEEYADNVVRKIVSDSLEGLAQKLVEEGLRDPDNFVKTIDEYNLAAKAGRAQNPGITWNPTVKDGLSTKSGSSNDIFPPKSNWALPISKPPYLAVKISCGITFTFGGLAIDPLTSGVISNRTGGPIPGLFCCGELVGGLFYGNYPGGSGLTAGAVFGRKAGKSASALLTNLQSDC